MKKYAGLLLGVPAYIRSSDSAPVITSPAADSYAESLTPTITWSGFGSADEIEIGVVLTGTPTETGIASGSYTADALPLSDNPYQVRVRKQGGAWSAIVEFYVDIRSISSTAIDFDARVGVFIDYTGVVPATQNGDPIAVWKSRHNESIFARIPTNTDSLRPSLEVDWLEDLPCISPDGIDDILEVAHATIGTTGWAPTVYALGEFQENTSPRWDPISNGVSSMVMFQKGDDYFAKTFNWKVIASLNGADLIGTANGNFVARAEPIWVRLHISGNSAYYTIFPIANAGIQYESTSGCNATGRGTDNVRLADGVKISRLIIFPSALSADNKSAVETYLNALSGIAFS